MGPLWVDHLLVSCGPATLLLGAMASQWEVFKVDLLARTRQIELATRMQICMRPPGGASQAIRRRSELAGSAGN